MLKLKKNVYRFKDTRRHHIMGSERAAPFSEIRILEVFAFLRDELYYECTLDTHMLLYFVYIWRHFIFRETSKLYNFFC